MVVALALAFVFAAPPGVGCGLTVDGETRLAQNTVQHQGVVGLLTPPAGYSITQAGGTVSTWTRERPVLATLTYKPKNGKTATFTCTQTQPRPQNDVSRITLTLACMVDNKELMWGFTSLSGTGADRADGADGFTWHASARAREVRIQAEHQGAFAATWSEEMSIVGNARSLTAFGHTVLCWRL